MKLYQGIDQDKSIESWIDIPCPYSCVRDTVENVAPDEYHEMAQWCCAQQGDGRFFWSQGNWYFELIEDATWFVMRWVIAYD